MPERFGQVAQRALDGVLDDCLADPGCTRAFPRIKEETQAVIGRIRRGPVRAAVRHPASGVGGDVTVPADNIVEAIRYMTYSSSGAARLPLFLHEAFAGNFAPLSQFLLDRRADGLFEGLYLSVTCTEDVPFMRAGAEEADEPTYLGAYRVREQRAACAEWGSGRVPAWHRTPVTSTRPVLILSGTRDPVTPPEYGDEIAKTLPNSVHLRIPAGGHSPDGLTGLDCLSNAERDFLAAADPKVVDASCLKMIARRGFQLELPRR
jgi:pimeloyl-ACP methyl ester carboxylesterase